MNIIRTYGSEQFYFAQIITFFRQLWWIRMYITCTIFICFIFYLTEYLLFLNLRIWYEPVPDRACVSSPKKISWKNIMIASSRYTPLPSLEQASLGAKRMLPPCGGLGVQIHSEPNNISRPFEMCPVVHIMPVFLLRRRIIFGELVSCIQFCILLHYVVGSTVANRSN